MKSLFKKGQKFGDWTLTSLLGSGGNGEVWKCINVKKEEGAIKLLKKITLKAYDRFLAEVYVMETKSDVPGIIPLIDKNLPKDLRDEIPYFVMPVAENAEKLLSGMNLRNKIEAIIEISQTLSLFHEEGISHRDIKPPNLLFYQSRLCLADFGLVKYPNKKDVSLKNEVIGPMWTMAPEMKRESTKANGQKADIYSLAKTLWIILTGSLKGFDGQYSPSPSLNIGQYYKSDYVNTLDKLISRCTSNEPSNRPSIEEFINELKEWLIINENFHKRNLEQWFEIQNDLFPSGFPRSVIWESPFDIVNVLKKVCKYDNLNHMFFPDGGGMDLEDIRLSHEEGCIEMDFEFIHIGKPKRLIFESFGDDPTWNYFRLELDNLETSGIYAENEGVSKVLQMENADKTIFFRESLSEIEPSKYVSSDIVNNRYENQDIGIEIPQNYRIINRWTGGSFVIFNKRSPYNMTTSTYDGRHDEMNADEFREYIIRNIQNDEKTYTEKYEHDTYLDGKNKIEQ